MKIKRWFGGNVQSSLSFEDQISLVLQSGLFDATWYGEKNELASSLPEDCVRHYFHENRSNPHPLFDADWYVAALSKNNQKDENPLVDFILRSTKTALSPHPLFDVEWYLAQDDKILQRDSIPFRDYLRTGAGKGISGHPLFDGAHYLSRQPDLRAQGVNPLTHYVEIGEIQGQIPNEFFDPGWYRASYGKDMRKNETALAHFIRCGASLGNRPAPGVDLDLYVAELGDSHGDRLKAFETLVTRDAKKYRVRFESPLVDEGVISQKHRSAVNDSPPELGAVNVNSGVESAMTKSQLVSFDLWDTVLRRYCHPDEIKLQSARYVWLSNFDNVKPAFRTIPALFRARVQAENRSARGDFEYRFADAVDGWLKTVLQPSASNEQRAELIQQLYDHELSAEISSGYTDVYALELLNRHHGTKIFASDFYMPQQFMWSLLKSRGVKEHFVGGYVSCDTFQNKRSGELYRSILKEHSLAPKDMLHIGDNTLADIEIPRNLGINVIHLEQENLEPWKSWLAKAMHEFIDENSSAHEERIKNLLPQRGNECSLEEAGQRYAPIFVGFVLGVLEDAIRKGVQTIFFFTREGLFLKKIYDRLVELNPYNLQRLPSSKLLEVSRLSTFSASLASADKQELMRLWRLYSSQSPNSFARSLGLDPAITMRAAARHKLSYDEIITYPWANDAFCAFLEDQEIVAHIKSVTARENSLLTRYLENAGFVDREQVNLIVDIGWRGTIQDNLAKVSQTFSVGHYLGLFRYLNPQPSNVTKSGWIWDDNSEKRSFAVNEVAGLEMLCNGVGGSVSGYIEEGGIVKPVFKKIPGEDAVIESDILRFQSGVLSGLDTIATYVSRHGLSAQVLREVGCNLMYELTSSPPKCVADAFNRLEHNETFGTGSSEMLSDVGSKLDDLSAYSGSELHHKTSNLIQAARWADAFIRSSGVEKWVAELTPAQRFSLPSAISAVGHPALVKSLGDKVCFFVPPPIVGSGGHRTIFNVARTLNRLGLRTEIFLEGIGEGLDAVENYLQGSRSTIHTSWHSGIAADLAFATIAHSASFVAEMPNVKRGAYLVQDFEASFNPLSDAYVVAETSYTYGLQHFTVGNWLTHVLAQQYQARAVPAGLGVDTSVYNPKKESSREKAICFLYQPDKVRRAPALGIQALKIVKEILPETKIYVYGSDRALYLDFEVENLGLIHDLSELNNLYNRCEAGLCISLSNPSRIPYEMMAAGCIPVDLFRYNNLFDHHQEACMLAYQSPQSIASAFISILTSPELAKDRRDACAKFSATRSLTWENDVIANGVLEILSGKRAQTQEVQMTYLANAILAPVDNHEEVLQFCEWQINCARPKKL